MLKVRSSKTCSGTLLQLDHNSIDVEVFAGKCLESFVPGNGSLKSRFKLAMKEHVAWFSVALYVSDKCKLKFNGIQMH